MLDFEIPTLTGEFIPVGTKLEIAAVPKGTSSELLALYTKEMGVLAKNTIERAMWLGEVLHGAQAALYFEKTGKRLSNERNERQGQISSISKDWGSALDVFGINKESASRLMQKHRDPEKAMARLEADREYQADKRAGGAGRLGQRPNQAADSSLRNSGVSTNKTPTRPAQYYAMVEDFRNAMGLIDKVSDDNIAEARRLAKTLAADLRKLT